MSSIFTTNDLPDLAFLCNQIHESLQLPVFLHPDSDLNMEAFWSVGLPPHPIFTDPVELYRSVAGKGTSLLGPVIRETNFMEGFIALPVKRNGQSQAVIVIGPVIRQKPGSEICANLLNDYGIPNRERSIWMEYWQNLPIMNRKRLLHISVLANWMINFEALDIINVLKSSLQYALPDRQMQKVDLALADRRESNIFNEGIEGTRLLIDLIRNGNKTELMKRLSEVTYNEKSGLSKRSQLRNVKNLAICGVAISMRAAVEGGLSEDLGFTLSDLHIQHIEELNEVILVEAAAIQAMVDFAERVDQCRKNNVSKPIYVCKEYIYRHLFEDITIQKLSELSGLNPDYLSQLFKKETGLTLMNYIQKERIEEAKKLLAHSNDTISTIGARLTFYDQSHFVKVFRKHAGLTPRQYRNQIRSN